MKAEIYKRAVAALCACIMCLGISSPSIAADEEMITSFSRFIESDRQQEIGPSAGVPDLFDKKIEFYDKKQAPVRHENADVMQEFYVSVSGSDTNSGTKNSPFKTISRARDAVREINQNMTGDIVVYIADGIYEQSQTLEFKTEDSGTNGYTVRYIAENENKATVSGGRKVTDWKQAEGNIWYTDIDAEYITELYVNGRMAQLARTEQMVPTYDFYRDDDPTYLDDGITLNTSDIGHLTNIKDVRLRFLHFWYNFELNCQEIIDLGNGKSAAIIDQPGLYLCTAWGYYMRGGYHCYIENAYELMDQPDEFYYDRGKKRLYYIPKDGENVNDSEIYVPVLEKLMTVDGVSVSDKVRNIEFRGLKFAHAAWHYDKKMTNRYGQASRVMDKDKRMFLMPGNVEVNYAEGIDFHKNTFYGLGAIGLFLNEAVSFSDISGNTFYDIKSGALAVGNEKSDYVTRKGDPYDAALGKTVKTSTSTKSTSGSSVVCGSLRERWKPDADDPGPWISVDTAETTNIDQVIVIAEGDHFIEKFKCIVSDNEDFSNPVELKEVKRVVVMAHDGFQAKTDAKQKYVFELPEASADKKYRYVKLCNFSEKTFFLNKIGVYDASREQPVTEEECNNITIENNYIRNVANYYFANCGITVYYANNIKVSHNHIEDVPYSGISVGWGWANLGETDTCYDNEISYNYIENSMLELHDGAGIYTLGAMPGTVVKNNYVKSQMNPHGGIYPDEGSMFVQVRDNVTEDVAVGLFLNTHQTCYIGRNYTTATMLHDNNNGTPTSETNIYYMPGHAPAEAQKIMKEAGLEKDYIYIMDKAADTGSTYSTMGLEYRQKVITANKEYSIGYTDQRYFQRETRMAELILKLAEEGTGMGQFPENSKAELKRSLDVASGLLKVNYTAETVFDEGRIGLRNEWHKFLEKTNRLSTEETRSYAEELLAQAKCGETVGTYTQDVYDWFKEVLNNPEGDYKQPDGYKALSEACIAFAKAKQQMGFQDITVQGQIGATKFDYDNAVINIKVNSTANLKNMKPIYNLQDGMHLSKETAEITDFSKPVILVVMNEEETQYRYWKVIVSK